MTNSPSHQSEDTFHKARSKLIDAFARLEVKLVKALMRANRPIRGDTLASKLKTIREATTPESLSESSEQLEKLAALLPFRADIVHGAMVLVDCDGERFANFRNAREAVQSVQRPSQISYKSLLALTNELSELTSQLDKLKFSPAS